MRFRPYNRKWYENYNYRESIRVTYDA
jgi:hypothetical protein